MHFVATFHLDSIATRESYSNNEGRGRCTKMVSSWSYGYVLVVGSSLETIGWRLRVFHSGVRYSTSGQSDRTVKTVSLLM